MNTYIEPPIGLFDKILNRIHKEERVLVIKKVIWLSITFFGSLVSFILTLRMLLSDFDQSGFLRFFYLVFSDFSTVTTYWQSFGMILLETLPAVSLILFLTVTLILLQSLKSLTKNIKIIAKPQALVIN